MANEKQSTDRVKALGLRANNYEWMEDGANAFCLKIKRPKYVRYDEIVFRSQAEVCEAIELLCHALRDAVQQEPWSVNYQNDPSMMEVQMVRI